VLAYYLPLFFWIWVRRVRGMSAKWPHSDVTRGHDEYATGRVEARLRNSAVSIAL
jgi:hypothetical protein